MYKKTGLKFEDYEKVLPGTVEEIQTRMFKSTGQFLQLKFIRGWLNRNQKKRMVKRNKKVWSVNNNLNYENTY